jgi:uncharacterized membrane protein YjdF
VRGVATSDNHPVYANVYAVEWLEGGRNWWRVLRRYLRDLRRRLLRRRLLRRRLLGCRLLGLLGLGLLRHRLLWRRLLRLWLDLVADVPNQSLLAVDQ